MRLSREHAEALTRQFAADYPGALQLAFYFRSTVAELYGVRAAGVSPVIKGGYVCAPTEVGGKHYDGRVDVPLDNMTDEVDLLDSLRHEVLGHYGINTLTPEVKRQLLDAVIASDDEPSMASAWADINQWYPSESLDIRAEEVFAKRCESLPRPADVAQRVVELGRAALRECCVTRRRPLTHRDLGAIACMVADGLRHRNQRQLTFLGVNDIRRGSASVSPALSGGLLAGLRGAVDVQPGTRQAFRPR